MSAIFFCMSSLDYMFCQHGYCYSERGVWLALTGARISFPLDKSVVVRFLDRLIGFLI